MVYIIYLIERKLSKGNYRIPGKMGAGEKLLRRFKRPFYGASGGLWPFLPLNMRFWGGIWVKNCTNLTKKLLPSAGWTIIIVGLAIRINGYQS